MYGKFLSAMVVAIATFMCQFAFSADVEKLAEDDWLLVKSANFEIITDLNEEKGRHLVEALEAYRFFSIQFMKLKVITGLKPLKILAIGNSSNFKKLDLPENWAGVFSLDTYGYSAIANVNNYSTSLKSQTFARQVLFHEYNHFLVRFTENVIHVPMWYDEGMAEYWGSFKYDGEKIYIGDPKAIEGRIYDLMNMGGNIILDSEKLLNTQELPLESAKEKDKDLVSRFYAQSFFLIHYFNSSPELRVTLNNYITYLNNGYRENQAFQKAFNMTYAELDKKAKSYLGKNLMMRVIGLKDEAIKFPQPAISISKLTQAGFYSQVSEILPNFSVIGRENSKKLLEKTIELNPDDNNAKASYLLRGFASDPTSYAAEIEKIAPQNPYLLTFKGNSLLWGGDIMRMGGVTGWEDNLKKARSYFRRAIKADPALALPYLGLGEVYKFLPATEPLEEGVVGLDTASLYQRNSRSSSSLADMVIRMDKGLDSIPALRNTIAFGKEKEKSLYSMILDNLELLFDTTLNAGKVTADGLLYDSGAIYVGQVVNGKPQGAGKITRPNGSYFDGSFNNGVMQGQGKLVTYGGYRYEGEFQNGIARGKGKIFYRDDSPLISYTGDIYYAMPSGKGISTSKTTTYDGEYWYGRPNGKGILTSSDGKIKLQGRWIFGGYEWPEENGIVFVGYVNAEGKRDGMGVCVTKANFKIDYCTYKDGIRQEKVTPPASGN